MVAKFKRKLFSTSLCLLLLGGTAMAEGIVHDAEYYILEAQNGTRWQAEDGQLNARLAELRQKARPTSEYCSCHVGRYGIWRCRHSSHPIGAWLEDAQFEQDGQRGHVVHTHVYRSWLHTESRCLHDGPPSRQECDVQHRHAA